MEDMTLGVIHAIKTGMKSPKENVIDFMSKWSSTDPKYYTDNEVKRILQMVFIDYLKTADNPSFDVYQFFEAKKSMENYRSVYPKQAKEFAEKMSAMDDDSEAIMTALRMSAVMKDGKYINGFKGGY